MKNKCSGFTLVELMIVVAIIGILASVAYPSYVQYVKKAQCADGLNALLLFAGRMEEFYLNNDSYVDARAALLPANANSPEGFYTLTITAQTAFLYTLTATPDDTNQFTMTLNSLGVKAETGGVAGEAVSCL